MLRAKSGDRCAIKDATEREQAIEAARPGSSVRKITATPMMAIVMALKYGQKTSRGIPKIAAKTSAEKSCSSRCMKSAVNIIRGVCIFSPRFAYGAFRLGAVERRLIEGR